MRISGSSMSHDRYKVRHTNAIGFADGQCSQEAWPPATTQSSLLIGMSSLNGVNAQTLLKHLQIALGRIQTTSVPVATAL